MSDVIVLPPAPPPHRRRQTFSRQEIEAAIGQAMMAGPASLGDQMYALCRDAERTDTPRCLVDKEEQLGHLEEEAAEIWRVDNDLPSAREATPLAVTIEALIERAHEKALDRIRVELLGETPLIDAAASC